MPSIKNTNNSKRQAPRKGAFFGCAKMNKASLTNNEFMAGCVVAVEPIKKPLTEKLRLRPITKNEWEAIEKPRQLSKYTQVTITSDKATFNHVKRKLDILLAELPRQYQKDLIARFCRVFKDKGMKKALKDITTITAPVSRVLSLCVFDDYVFLRDDKKRQNFADNVSQFVKESIISFTSLAYRTGVPSDEMAKTAYKFICERTTAYRKDIPYPIKSLTTEQAESGLLRLMCADYWSGYFDTQAKRTNEHLAIALGYVKKKYSPYVSKAALQAHKAQLAANKEYLELMEAVNTETGEKHSLAELVKLGSGDPEKRRIELMVRCRGLEELALSEGKEALFLTITAPSKYHCVSKIWNVANPRNTSEYLCKLWSRIRAKLAREEIEYNGVRVSEPHADATPHWHMLLFVEPSRRAELTAIIERYTTKEDKDELIKGYEFNQRVSAAHKGVKLWSTWCQPRFTAELIDPKKGSATGYIAKYISKNINGAGIENEKDHDGKIKIDESAARVVAWASLWGIRQFQFFGAVSVSVWRECRRAKTPFENPLADLVRQAADKSNWLLFTRFMRMQKLSLVYETDEEKNKYNEEITRIKGVKLSDESFITRLESFELKKKDLSFSWSPVINCTPRSGESEIIATLSDRDLRKLKKIGFSDDGLTDLLSGKLSYVGIQQFKIVNGELITH
jgi:hypothetical protein